MPQLMQELRTISDLCTHSTPKAQYAIQHTLQCLVVSNLV